MSKVRVSKTDDTGKVVIADQSLLNDLGLWDTIKTYKKAAWKLQEYSLELSGAKDAIQEIICGLDADTLVYGEWRTTLVKPEPRSYLVEEKLRTNLMKIGKLDAVMVETILKASKTKLPAAPYVRVYAPEGELPKKSE